MGNNTRILLSGSMFLTWGQIRDVLTDNRGLCGYATPKDLVGCKAVICGTVWKVVEAWTNECEYEGAMDTFALVPYCPASIKNNRIGRGGIHN